MYKTQLAESSEINTLSRLISAGQTDGCHIATVGGAGTYFYGAVQQTFRLFRAVRGLAEDSFLLVLSGKVMKTVLQLGWLA